MTTELPVTTAVLVVAATSPAVEGPVVDVRPGPMATFAGGRPRSSLTVTASDDDAREIYARGQLHEALAAVENRLRTREDAVVRLGNREWLCDFRPRSAVRAIERKVATVAGRQGAPLLTWTDGDPWPADVTRYDLVVDATGPRRGQSA